MFAGLRVGDFGIIWIGSWMMSCNECCGYNTTTTTTIYLGIRRKGAIVTGE